MFNGSIKKKSNVITNNSTVPTIKKKPESKGSKKSEGSVKKSGGYNEGAEENKAWVDDN